MEEKRTVCIGTLCLGTGRPKICVPLVQPSSEELVQEAHRLRSLAVRPELVEWRADWFEGIRSKANLLKTLKEIRQALDGIPLLFTIRTKGEGGQLSLSFDHYAKVLLCVAKSGYADALDVELFFASARESRALVRRLQEESVTVIGSHHNFERTPLERAMLRRLRMMRDMGADIAKLAVMPQREEDVLKLLSATLKAKRDPSMCPVITMSMDAMGVPSRTAGGIFGSVLTFASAGQASAPGQIEIGKLRESLELYYE